LDGHKDANILLKENTSLGVFKDAGINILTFIFYGNPVYVAGLEITFPTSPIMVIGNHDFLPINEGNP
jgi:hypothetical protein